MRCYSVSLMLAITMLLSATPRIAWAQYGSSICLPDVEQAEAERQPPPKEPRMIDPGEFLPAPLTKKLTLEFDDHPLNQVVEEISRQIGMQIILDSAGLHDDGFGTDEPVSVHLRDESAYVALERWVSRHGLGWYTRDDVLHLTTITVSYAEFTTKVRVISDLVQLGYDPSEVSEVISECVDANWGEGIQPLFFMTDTILVTCCSDEAHRQIDAILAALRNHGMQTSIQESESNLRLRQKLLTIVDVDIDDLTLKDCFQMLSEQADVPIRIDADELQENGISLTELVSLTLKGKSLATVVSLICSDVQLEAVPIHGELLITSVEQADHIFSTTVFGVGDLSQNWCETRELIEMITSQIYTADWVNRTGTGGTALAPRHDVLVVRNSDRVLSDVRHLLDDFRSELAKNPPPEIDYTEIETRYYTVTAEEAADLLVTIPELIEPGTWKRVTNPEELRIETLAEDGIGSLLRVAAEPYVETVTDRPKDPEAAVQTVITPQATLIIRHTKLTQLKVAQLIRRLSDYNLGTNDAGEDIHGPNSGGGFFQIIPEKRHFGPTLSPTIDIAK